MVRLLLELNNEYCFSKHNPYRAKIYTEIHAKPKHVVGDDAKASSSSDGATATTSSDATSETSAKKSCNATTTSAIDKKAQAKKEKSLKDKKKTLKRLWKVKQVKTFSNS